MLHLDRCDYYKACRGYKAENETCNHGGKCGLRRQYEEDQILTRRAEGIKEYLMQG